MKINYILLLMLLQIIPCMAQPFGEAQDGWRIYKSLYSNSSGEEGFSDFYYNSDGLRYKGFWSLVNKKRSSVNFYQNDENGHIIHSFREFSDSLTSFEIFQYDEFGHKIFEQFSRSDSIFGTANYHYKKHELVKAEFHNHKGWLTCDIEYLYKNNRRKAGILKRNHQVIGSIDYEYDKNGNLIKEYWDFSGKWNQTFIYKYEKVNRKKRYYSSPFLKMADDIRIKFEDYTYNNEKGGPSYYQYDNKGQLVIKEFLRSDSLKTITHFEYDKRGRLIHSFRNYSDNKKASFNYRYDTNDNLVFRQFFMNDSLIGYESYFYDSEGKLCKAVLKNFDNWISGTIDFSYSKTDIMEKGFFKGENGFDATIFFKYNDEHLLNQILWEFTFGKFQKYTFQYEQN